MKGSLYIGYYTKKTPYYIYIIITTILCFTLLFSKLNKINLEPITKDFSVIL